jgi:hypothetical protein
LPKFAKYTASHAKKEKKNNIKQGCYHRASHYCDKKEQHMQNHYTGKTPSNRHVRSTFALDDLRLSTHLVILAVGTNVVELLLQGLAANEESRLDNVLVESKLWIPGQ